MIKIFDPNDRDFKSNGNICINPISCIEKKKKSLNGWYLDIKVDIKYKNYIKKDYLVVIKTKSSINPQAFRIADDDNDSTIQLTDNYIIFKANHVFFDSKRYFLVDIRPKKLNAISALEYINERTDKKSPFFVYSDIDSVSTSYFIRKNLLEAWAVFEERYSGYFQFDNWNVRLMSTIGKETGEIIAYGQKLQGFQVYESWANVVTKLFPTGDNGLMLDEKFIESDIQYDIPYTKTVQFTSDLDIEQQTEENLKNELKIKAQNYLNENKYPLISYEVTSDINQDLDIGDKAHIKHPLADIKVEVVEYTFDHVQKNFISIVFGNFVRDVKSKFDAIKKDIINQSEKLSEQEKVIFHQTELINNLNKNGLVYIDDNEILILDKVPKEQAKNVWRWGLGGFAFSSNGYEGPFSTAITMDGQINADFITTGKINTNLIEGYDQLVQKVSKTEESIEKITTTTQKSIGKNHLCLNEALPASALEYTIYGKSEQKVVKKADDPNLFNLASWNGKVNAVDWYTHELDGNLVITENSLIMSNPSNNHQITNSFFDASNESEEMRQLVKDIVIEAVSGEIYTIAFDCPFLPDPDSELNYQTSSYFESLILSYDNNLEFLGDGSTQSIKYENGRYIVKHIPSNGARYISIAFINKTYEQLNDTTLTISDISIRKNHSEYIPYEDIEEIPTPENPSEIKTIPSIRNLLDIDLMKFSNKGLNIEFEKSKIKVNGTSINIGNQIVKSKTRLDKGTYTISFYKLGGTLESNGNDCQVFIQTSDGTTERITNITGSRLENGENAKTTIDFEEDKEIYVYFYFRNNVEFNNYEIGIQIEKGHIAHDYRPTGAYTKVKITGKNQFNLKKASRMSYSYSLPNKTSNSITVDNFDSNNLSFSITENNYAYILSNTNFLKPNTEYILSYNRKNNNYSSDSNTRYYIYDIDENGNYVLNQNSTDSIGYKEYSFTTNETGMIAFAWGGNNKCSGASSVISNIMLIEKKEETKEMVYEPSKENEILIDLNKYDSDENIVGYYELCTNDILKIEGDNVEIHKEIGKIVLDGKEDWQLSTTSLGNDYYRFLLDNIPSKLSANEILVMSDTFMPIAYNDRNAKYKNTICVNGNIEINTNIATTVDEFKTWLSENNVTVYYELAEPQDILLPKAEIQLFEGINHIQFLDDIETNTSIYFIKKTLISGEYVIQPQLNQTNKNLSNTDDKTNKNISDINATNTNLNNNYYNKEQIDIMNTSTEQIITQIRNQVEMTTSATNLQISVLEEKILNGVTSITTETGYKFDKEGLSISKTGEPMKSLLDNDGLRVYRDSTIMLKANSNEVYAQNLIVNTYFVQRPIRREQGISISDGKSIGVVEYWVGIGDDK